MGGLPNQATRMTLAEAGNPDSVKLGSRIWGAVEQLYLSQSGRLSQGVVPEVFQVRQPFSCVLLDRIAKHLPVEGSCLCRL